jgi:hypothetical protein
MLLNPSVNQDASHTWQPAEGPTSPGTWRCPPPAHSAVGLAPLKSGPSDLPVNAETALSGAGTGRQLPASERATCAPSSMTMRGT